MPLSPRPPGRDRGKSARYSTHQGNHCGAGQMVGRDVQPVGQRLGNLQRDDLDRRPLVADHQQKALLGAEIVKQQQAVAARERLPNCGKRPDRRPMLQLLAIVRAGVANVGPDLGELILGNRKLLRQTHQTVAGRLAQPTPPPAIGRGACPAARARRRLASQDLPASSPASGAHDRDPGQTELIEKGLGLRPALRRFKRIDRSRPACKFTGDEQIERGG